MQVIGTIVGVLAVLAATAGCARPTVAGAAPGPSAAPSAGGSAPASAAATPEAGIYVPVLRRYLGSSDNSFPGQAFATTYVVDRVYDDAADPTGKHVGGAPIAAETQRQITAALAGTTEIVFIADRATVIETKNGCAQVKEGTILITLGPPDGDDREVRVAVYGFVACLGATWLTYVVQRQPGSDWQVTGTTGTMAIA